MYANPTAPAVHNGWSGPSVHASQCTQAPERIKDEGKDTDCARYDEGCFGYVPQNFSLGEAECEQNGNYNQRHHPIDDAFLAVSEARMQH